MGTTITPVLTQARKRSMNSTRFGMKKQSRSPGAKPREEMKLAIRSLRVSSSPKVSVATEPSAQSYSSASADARPFSERLKMSVNCILPSRLLTNAAVGANKTIPQTTQGGPDHELLKPTWLHSAAWPLSKVDVLPESGSSL